MLDKLLKTFPKSSELNKKIFILINKSNKLKEKGNKLTSGKESQKESRSKSQIKSDIKKIYQNQKKMFQKLKLIIR